MKKILLILGFIFLSNCDIKPRTVSAQFNNYLYEYKEETRNGMKYGVWYVNGDRSNREDAIFVVNLDKDALEVELLRKQLAAMAH